MTVAELRQAEPGAPAGTSRARLLDRLDLVLLYAAGIALVFLPGALDRDLPNYARALAATAVLLVIPGLAVFRLIAPRTEQRLPRALASAIPLAVLGLLPAMTVSFIAGLPIEAFLGIALGTGAVLVLLTASPLGSPASTSVATRWSVTPGEETLGLILLIVAVSPIWLRFDISRDFDDWWYLGYVRQYMDADELKPRDPMAGPGGPISGRAATNAWLLAEGGICRLGDLDPVYFVQTFLPPLLLAAALLAAYALTRRLTGSEGAGQWAVFFIALAAAIDVLAPEGLGRMLLLRSAQDKVVAGLLAAPVALLFVLDALGQPRRRTLVALALAAVALVAIHPHGLALVGAAGAGILALEWSATGTRRPGRNALLVGGLAIAVVAAVGLALWLRVAEESPELFEAGTGPRPEYRVIDLPLGLSMANPGVFRNPLLVAAILLTLPLVSQWRRDRSARVMIALAWVPVAATLIPPISTLAGRVVSPDLLWRFTWLVPVGPVLGYWAARVIRPVRLPFLRRIAGAAVALCAVSIAIGVQEVSVLADPGYHAGDGLTSDRDIVIVRSWHYVFDEVQRASDAQRELLRAVTRHVPAGSLVAADPFLSRAIVAYKAGVIPFAPVNAPTSNPIVRDRSTLLEPGTPRPLRRAIIQRYGITHVIVPAESTADEDLALKRGVKELFRGRRYVLFQVTSAPRTGDPLAKFGVYSLWRGIVVGEEQRRPARIVLRSVWTASSPAAATDELTADLVDAGGNRIGDPVVVATGSFQVEVPFSHRFIFPVPPGEGDYVVRISGPGGEPVPLADVSVNRGPGGVEIFVNPRDAGATNE